MLFLYPTYYVVWDGRECTSVNRPYVHNTPTFHFVVLETMLRDYFSLWKMVV